MNELKPCPWCKSKQFYYFTTQFNPNKGRIRCSKCLADGPLATGEEQAIAAWNARAVDAGQVRAITTRIRKWGIGLNRTISGELAQQWADEVDAALGDDEEDGDE